MRHNYYELSSDSLDLCKGKLTPGVTATWGEIAGNIETQKDLVSYISAHGTAAWGSISGSITDQTDLIEYTDRFATTAWVQEQGYLTEHQDLTGYATESWVQSQGYLVSDDLSQYATRQWVTGRGYITSSALSGYATESWVSSQGYITSAVLTGYATQSWVSSQGYYKVSSYYAPVETHDYFADPDFSLPPEFPLEFNGSIIGTEINDLYIGGFYPVEFEPGVEYTEFGGLHITPYDLTWYMVTAYDDGEGLQYTVEDIPFVKQTDLDATLYSYATKSWVSSQGYLNESSAAIQSIEARLSALETNYGDALSITNNILS